MCSPGINGEGELRGNRLTQVHLEKCPLKRSVCFLRGKTTRIVLVWFLTTWSATVLASHICVCVCAMFRCSGDDNRLDVRRSRPEQGNVPAGDAVQSSTSQDGCESGRSPVCLRLIHHVQNAGLYLTAFFNTQHQCSPWAWGTHGGPTTPAWPQSSIPWGDTCWGCRRLADNIWLLAHANNNILTLLAGWREGHPVCKKKLGVGLLVVNDLSGALHIF